MALSKITTHAANALARLAMQFRGRPLFEAVAVAVGNQAQGIEDALIDLALKRLLDANSEGAQLDVLGRILKLPRLGATDAVYLSRLKAQVRINLSSGTTEDLISVFRAVLAGTDAIVKVEGSYPAGFVLRIMGTTIDATTAALYATFLKASRAAGVYGLLETADALDADTFQCADPCAFVSAAVLVGDASITAADLDGFDPSGQLSIDEGTTTWEVVTYSAIAGSVITLDGTASKAHDVGATIRPYPAPVANGPGFGDTTDPAAGGKLASVLEG